MKKIFLLISLAISPMITFSQTAFYEAQYLNTIDISILNDITGAAAQSGLSTYEIAVVNDYKLFVTNPFNVGISKLDINALKRSIEKYNTYVEMEHKKEIAYLQGGSVGSSYAGATILSMIPSLVGGNFSLNAEQQTKIIDGLTKYYAEEFRKAQLITYMQTFKSTIGKIGELEVLFPKTYAKLQNADPSKFPELGDEYKSIFNEDLKSVIDNVINHIDNHTQAGNATLENKLEWLNETNNGTIKNNEYYDCIKITADIGSKLINNYHPVDLMTFLDNKYYNATLLTAAPKKADKVKLILHGLNLVQRNLLDTLKTKDSQFRNVWLNVHDLGKLDTSKEWNYFIGLIYQQDRDFFDKYFFTPTGPFATPAEIDGFKTKINNILSALVELQDFRANLKDDNVKDNFVGYMNLVIKAIQASDYYSSFQLTKPEFKKYIQLADYTLNIYDNVRKKDYNNTLYYTILIFKELAPIANDNVAIVKIEKYGTFMTDVINAKDSNQVKEVIKKHAAPPTSFILKREFVSTLSITGQPGYFVSVERLNGQSSAFVSGITLPMGFELTFKLKPGTDNSGSIGFFAQLIDLGAVLNFRVNDETSTLPDKIEFKQIFSPGASITYGLKNSPLTIGLGYQYTPQLRKITENGSDIYPNGNRIFLRIGWDIPLINISKSTKK